PLDGGVGATGVRRLPGPPRRAGGRRRGQHPAAGPAPQAAQAVTAARGCGRRCPMIGPVRYALPGLVGLLAAASAPPQDPEGKPALIGTLKHEAAVRALRFSADGRTLTAVVHPKREVVRWDLAAMTQRTVARFPDDGMIDREAFSPGG